jgi:hypothetical protein
MPTNRKMKKLLLASLISTNAFAISGVGEYRYGPDTTENFACEMAEERARENAIVQYVGQLVEAQIKETCKRDECVFQRDTFSEFNGYIKGIRNKKVSKQVFDGYSACIVTVEADVSKLNNTIRFEVSGRFDVRHEDGVQYTVVSNKTGKVAIFNYRGNRYQKILEATIAAKNRQVVLPYDNTKRFVARVPEGKNESKELLMFIFTESDVEYKNDYSSFEIKNLIASIPPTDRKVVNRYVNIVR